MKHLADIQDLKGKKVLLRLDLNVSIAEGIIVDDFRLKQSLPTLVSLLHSGAKVIIVGHIESKEGTLFPVFEYFRKLIPISFVADFLQESDKKIISEMKAGTAVLLENIRKYSLEKDNDSSFAQSLASLADMYVNEAFSVSHRAHASIVGVPKFLPSYAGELFQSEVEHLSRAFHPPHPFLFILGGAKFETKLPLVEKFFTLADFVFVGGALANDLFQAKGFEVGVSVLSGKRLDLSSIVNNPKLLLPLDVKVQDQVTREIRVKKPDAVLSHDKILDAGPQTVALLREKIKDAKCVLWNGPLGQYEDRGFREPTLALAKIIAESSTLSIVGGGDTLAAITELRLQNKFSFLSTGGGAMLEFLANETLPGIEALK